MMSEFKPTDTYLRYQAMYYYMNERYSFATAVSQKDFRSRDGISPSIEYIREAMDIAKRCEELVGIARKEYEDEENVV